MSALASSASYGDRTMPEIKSKKTPTPAKKGKKEEASIVHDKVTSTKFEGEKSLTPAQAKEYLGWEEESEGAAFGDVYTLTDRRGVKVRCTENDTNRPFNEPWALRLAQDILNKRWAFNGESIVISRTGKVLSGQHRLIALVLAEQMRTGEQAEHWAEVWGGHEVSIDTIVVTGIDESPDTTATLDNTRPRSDTDILYTDTALFSKFRGKKREVLCGKLGWAIKLVWQRTGMDRDAFHSHRTSSETRDFAKTHSSIEKMVVHCVEEDEGQKGNLSSIVSLGYAAGIAYLMAASGSDGEKYRAASPRTEKKLDFSAWDKAQEFVVDVAAKAPNVAAIFAVTRPVEGDAKGRYTTKVVKTAEAKFSERIALLINAWTHYGSEMTPGDLKLDYSLKFENDKEGAAFVSEVTVVDPPILEGIDTDPTEHDEEGDPPAPEPEELEAVAEKVRNGDHREEKPDGSKMKATTPGNGQVTKVPHTTGTAREKFEAAKGRYDGYLLLIKNRTGSIFAYGEDAVEVGKVCGIKTKEQNDLTQALISVQAMGEVALKMAEAGYRVGLLEEARVSKIKDGVGVSEEKFTVLAEPAE